MNKFKIISATFGVVGVCFGLNMLVFILKAIVQTYRSLGLEYGREYLAVQIGWLILVIIFVCAILYSMLSIFLEKKNALKLTRYIACAVMIYSIYHMWSNKELISELLTRYNEAPKNVISYMFQIIITFAIPVSWLLYVRHGTGPGPGGKGKELNNERRLQE